MWFHWHEIPGNHLTLFYYAIRLCVDIPGINMAKLRYLIFWFPDELCALVLCNIVLILNCVHWIGYVAIILLWCYYADSYSKNTAVIAVNNIITFIAIQHCKYMFQIKLVVLALLCFTVLFHQSHGLGFQNIICSDRCRYRFKQCMDSCVLKNGLEKDFNGGYEECMNMCTQYLSQCSCPISYR